jgi:hypothetical protein
MLGLLLWHEDTGDPQALAAATKIGDLLCAKFLGTGRRVVDTGSPEMNQAVVHGLALLYRHTQNAKHLALARQVVDEFAMKAPDGVPAGDYLRSALAGKEFFQCPRPRWESLHPIMGLAELSRLTGDDDCRKAFEHIWWSIAKLDRHNTGGFSSGEQAQGNPYHQGAIETCCTIAWAALSVEMLRMTGRSIVADELEISTFNAIFGYQSRTGAWSTYNTPMEGTRRPSKVEIAFQKRPGSEDVNCCSANSARGFGLVGEWALMTDGRGLLLNWYGPSTMTARIGGTRVGLRQETDYPRGGRIVLKVEPERALSFPLKLRIPQWSRATAVKVNGAAVGGVRPGGYLAIERQWAPGDTVELALDMSLHFWVGQREYAGKASIYRGPLLLAHRARVRPAVTFSPHWKKYGDLWAASEVGAWAEYTFEGDGIRWIGRKFDDAAMSRVTIDGKEVAIVDQYDPSREVPFSWEHKGLGPGRHTIRITVLDRRHKDSKGNFGNIVALAAPEETAAAFVFDARTMVARLLPAEGPQAPILLIESAEAGGRKVQLCDFATAGEGGAEYATWFKVDNVPATPFSQAHPLPSGRP